MTIINSSVFGNIFHNSLVQSGGIFQTATSTTGLTTPACVWMGDSITAGTGTFSIADWTNFYLSGQLVPVVGYDQGVSGNQTSQMIARNGAALSVVSSYSGQKIYFLMGGTNDIVVGGLPASTIITNLNTLITQALTVCDKVCIRTIMKRGQGNALTPTQETVRTTVNAWIMSITDSRVITVNYDNSTWDPSLTTPLQSNDGLHPNNYGVHLLGKYTAQQIASYFNTVDVLANTSGNLLPSNGDLSGTSGGQSGSTGQVATNCQVRNFIAGITGVNSKGTLEGRTSQIMFLNGTATNASFCQFRQIPPGTIVGQSGEVYEFLMRLKITGTSNMSNPALSQSTAITLPFSSGTVDTPLNQDIDGVIRCGRILLGATTTVTTIDLNVSSVIGAVTNLQIEVAQPILRKIS